MSLEPFNPFDTSDKVCFPAVEEGLIPGVGPEGSAAAAVVDIDQLSRNQPADIDTQHPPELGYLPSESSQLLEARCQAWFDVQSSLKAIRVGATFGCCLCAEQLPRVLCLYDSCQLDVLLHPQSSAQHNLFVFAVCADAFGSVAGRFSDAKLQLHPSWHTLC
jgi:hypothetical protein